MRRVLLLCLLLQFTLLPLHAQRLKWLRQTEKAALENGTHALPGKMGVSYQLNRRLAQSYRAATQALQQIPPGKDIPVGEPARRGIHVQKLEPQELYPDVPFLTTSQQTADYLLARNNRLFLQERKRMEQVWEQVNTALPTLTRESRQLEQPEDPLQWLSDQIPTGLDQLFIGETHGHKEIRETVRQLLGTIRQKYPQRQIILFTEFIPQEITWENAASTDRIPKYLQEYVPLWEQAVQNDIRVIGLEPQLVVQDKCTCSYMNSSGKQGNMSIWATLEGVRLRNERWMQMLTAYRTQYPDALFVIYTGADHSLYNRPFALTANYPKETTFVTALYPDKKVTYVSSGRWNAAVITAAPYSGPLEKISDQADFPQPVLKWSSAQLSQIAGYDVRVKIPIQLEEIDY